MQASGIPAKNAIRFAEYATSSYVRAVPVPSQTGTTPGAASFADGFPPITFILESAGGIPPDGRDMNGILQQLTSWSRWTAAGGPIAYDATFSAAIGGYPNGAIVRSAAVVGREWLSVVDNNVTNPDAGGAGWLRLGALPPVVVTAIGTTQVPVPAGALRARITVIGAGGGGGGCGATGVGQIACASGGGSGGYTVGLFDIPGITALAAIIGAGGSGGLGANTGTGGSSTIVSGLPASGVISASGGYGGYGCLGGSTPSLIPGGPGANVGSGGYFNLPGSNGSPGIVMSGTNGVGGSGAGVLGTAGGPSGQNGNGGGATVPGAGGGGAALGASSGGGVQGGQGAAGYVSIEFF